MNPLTSIDSRSFNVTENKSGPLLGVTIGFLTLAWISVCLRFYVRICISHSSGADDWVMLVALLLFTSLCGLTFAGIAYGTGRHLVDLSSADAQTAIMLWFFAELIYIVCAAIARISVAIFLLRVTVKKSHRIGLWATALITTAYNTFFFFYLLFSCTPISLFWTRITGLYHGHCYPIDALIDATFAATAVAAAADLTYALMPIAMLWNAQMDRRTKITVSLILSLGAVSGVAVIIRIPYVKSLESVGDFLFHTVNLAIWSILELAMGIIAGSLATLRPLVRKFQAKLRTQTHSQPPSKTATWKRSNATTDSQRPWSSDGTLAGINMRGPQSPNTFREGALSRDGLRMNPQTEDPDLDILRMHNLDHKRSSGSSTTHNRGEDYEL